MKKFIQSYPIEILFSTIFLTIAAILNLQFLEGANINRTIAGHDEYLTVREVYSILNPLSFKHFILAVIGGDILYYGRVVFYTDALFAFIPYKIWGIEGMVYAIRMTHSIWLLLGLLILNVNFLKGNLYKFLFLFGSFGLYYTLYFIQMPKPEPLQLVFLALFVRGFVKNNYQFGVHFIWLGLALAAKINVLVILPFMFVIPIVHYWNNGLNELIIKALKGAGWFVVGFFIGMPCLLLTPIQPVYLQTYLRKTIFGSEKSYDIESLTAIDWIKGGLGGNYFGNSWVGILFLTLVTVLFIYLMLKYFKDKELNQNIPIFIIGIVFTLFIVFMTKRLWPHYLWTGFIFLWLGVILFAENEKLSMVKKGLTTLVLVFFAFSAYPFYKNSLPSYLNRLNQEGNKASILDGKELYIYIESQFAGKSIGTDGTVWYPYQHFLLAKPYHPFASERPQTCETCITWHPDHQTEIWEENDIVIFNLRHPPDFLSKEKDSYSPENWEEILAEYTTQTTNNFQLDTVIGSNWVYVRK